MAYVGARLRELRQARQLTQDDLAGLTGITRTDLSGIENNRISIGPGRASTLAQALSVSVLELIPEAEPDLRGKILVDRLEELEEWVKAAAPEIERLGRRVAALERRAPPTRSQAEN